SCDRIGFSESSFIYTNSPTTSRRLSHYNGIDSTVLRPPLNDPELFAGGENGDYVLATGRVNGAKRQALLISALRYAPTVQLVVAGPPDSEEDSERLRRLAVTEGVEDRVNFELRFLARSELAALVNGARAVIYLPFDEDSVGYCTMEAFHAGKPVITTADSGGVLDLVKDGESGLVVQPHPAELAHAMTRLAGQAGLAARLGAAGRVALHDLGLTWPSTIERLLA
ncbi:MAG: glycosyltransferase family 4 protein, partial [Caulobacteraceae bacterium]